MVEFSHQDGTGSEYELDFNVHDGGYVHTFFHNGPYKEESEANAFPTGEWFCFQIEDYMHDVDGFLEVSINENPVVTMDGYDTLPAIPYDFINFGIAYSTEEQLGAEIHWDDVIIDDEYIPCE